MKCQVLLLVCFSYEEGDQSWHQTEIVTTKLQRALSCKMKRQTDCLTERKWILFLQQTQQTLVFCLVLAATTTNSDNKLWQSQLVVNPIMVQLSLLLAAKKLTVSGKLWEELNGQSQPELVWLRLQWVTYSHFVCVCLYCSALLASLEVGMITYQLVLHYYHGPRHRDNFKFYQYFTSIFWQGPDCSS